MISTSTPARRSIEVAGIDHASPIPAASRVGNVIMTGAIYGRNSATGAIDEAPSEQITQMFKNLESVLNAGGAALKDVVKLSISVSDLALRPLINESWAALFPDPHSRPARRVTRYEHLPEPSVICCEAYAVIVS